MDLVEQLIHFTIIEGRAGWTVISDCANWENQFRAEIEDAIVLAKMQSDTLGPARITIRTLDGEHRSFHYDKDRF